MKKKKIFAYGIAVLLLLMVVAIVGGIKFMQIRELISSNDMGMPPEVVATAEVERGEWERLLVSTGTARAIAGVRLTAEAPGLVEEILFQEGTVVERGDVLLHLDQSVEKAELAAARANLDLANINYRRSKDLLDQRVISQSEYDSAKANRDQAEASLALAEARINLKTIRAPFAGRLGIRRVDTGEFLQPGQTVTTLQSDDGLYVDFSLPQRYLSKLSPGMKVRAKVRGEVETETIEGVLKTIEPDVDIATRTLSLRAEFPESDGLLLPGMFVQIEVIRDGDDEVLFVPGTSVRYAPFGNSLFVVIEDEDGKLIADQRFIRLGRTRGDFVQVLEGVEEGEQVVSAGVFKLRNQSPIEINNEGAAEAEMDPKPDEA